MQGWKARETREGYRERKFLFLLGGIWVLWNRKGARKGEEERRDNCDTCLSLEGLYFRGYLFEIQQEQISYRRIIYIFPEN